MLELGELNSLTIGSMDYIACGTKSNAYYHCGADSFLFSPDKGLSFSLGEYGSDPEGWRGGGHLIESGKMSYEYQFDPYTTTEHHLYWTEGTVLGMMSASPVTPVPEAPAWAMLAAGLGAVGLWRRRPAKLALSGQASGLPIHSDGLLCASLIRSLIRLSVFRSCVCQ